MWAHKHMDYYIWHHLKFIAQYHDLNAYNIIVGTITANQAYYNYTMSTFFIICNKERPLRTQQ